MTVQADQGVLLHKVALVTGAGSGIGHGIAQVLAARGWKVAVNDLDEELAQEVADELDGLAVAGDVHERSEAIVSRTIEVYGRLDGLVNNAGKHARAPLRDVTRQQMLDVYQVNLEAPVRMIQAALAHLEVVHGSIVNITSIAARTPQMDVGLYTASKAGLEAITRQAAVELGPLGIRVNAVAPGVIRTGMAEVVYADPELHEKRRGLVPLRRIGTPADVGGAVAFLLSDDAAYVTGQTIVVDGGFTQVLIDLLPHPR